jgi:hypothetical protein
MCEKMISNVTETEFVDRFVEMDRKENFSYHGRIALFNYFEELEEDMGENIEFDCIAICCEYSEYEDLKDFHKVYDKEDYPDMETIRDHTQVIEIFEDSESFIIANF